MATQKNSSSLRAMAKKATAKKPAPKPAPRPMVKGKL